MTVEELKVLITAETSGLQKEIKKVQNQLNSLDKTTTKATSRIGNAFKKIGKVMGIATITAGLYKLGKSAVSAASDLEEVQNVVDVAFGDASKDIDRFAKTCIDRFGLSEYAAKKMASTFMSIGSSMGIANSSAKTMSVQLTGLAADMASFYNTSVDAVSSALEGIYTGQTRALRQYGIVVDDATLAEYALSQGIKKSVSSMTAAEKATLRYNYVLKQTANAQNDFARTSSSWANAIRVLKQQWNTLMAEMGGVVTTILTPVIKALSKVLAYLIAIAKAFKAVFGKGTANDAWAMGLNKAVKDSMKPAAAVASSASDISVGLSDATKSATKLKKTLAGFDELEVLNGKDEGGGGTGDIDIGGGFDVDAYFNPDDWEMPDLSMFQLQVQMFLEKIKEQFSDLTAALQDNTKTIQGIFD